jgi:hypothetical protein
MDKKSESGSGMNNPDHTSESLETIFLVKIRDINSLMQIQDSGWKKFGSGIEKLRIQDKHHCQKQTKIFSVWDGSFY